ncbi:YdcF family protein [Alloalcanivorax gelatiniphagus]|uniref:YdcF family protein n=2 Tax=Alloalcanivorax gelatiniphagus TaxID=1194167 RepID=A0ABY2XJR9_9GAMM|nr:YdcF family protein [Alloalcanivorax gelatiniphagus]TMW12189.1 YdcF family protein [Alloalcanivorax gelatiniphagus]
MRGVLITVVLGLALAAATLPVVVRQFYPPLPAARVDGPGPRAVVVPGAGRQRHGDGYRLTAAGLRRLHRGVEEARRLGLPLLLTGGAGDRTPRDPDDSEAAMMADQARRLWPEARLWIEPRSRSTWENALNSAPLLRRHGIQSVLLVTDRAHLPRATLSFRRQGLTVTPLAVETLPRDAWLPSAGALAEVPVIWREWVALVWYRVRYF